MEFVGASQSPAVWRGRESCRRLAQFSAKERAGIRNVVLFGPHPELLSQTGKFPTPEIPACHRFVATGILALYRRSDVADQRHGGTPQPGCATRGCSRSLFRSL